MNQRNFMVRIGISTSLLAGFLAASANVCEFLGAPDSEQVSKLLSEAKTLAFQVKEDAVTMESFTRMNLSWDAHKAAITQIRERVNDLGRQVAKLNAAKSSASPWQKGRH